MLPKIKQKSNFLDKKTISQIISTLLFIGCSLFVAIRGQKCFSKYLEKPQVAPISYEFNGKMNFPSLTICLGVDNAYKDHIFHECQLDKSDYIENGPWVGTGKADCTDPKVLFNQATAKLEDLDIQFIEIETFIQTHEFRKNNISKSINWEDTIPYGPTRICFKMTIPNEIIVEGKRIIKKLTAL